MQRGELSPKASRRNHILGRVLAAVLWLPLGSAAIEIPITNYSFEEQVVDEGGYINASVPGWTGSGPVWGVANPNDSHFSGTSTGSSRPNPINGKNAASINSGSKMVYDFSGVVLAQSAIYELTFLAGHRAGSPFESSSVSLWAGTTMLGELFPTPPEDRFVPMTLTYTSPPAGPMIGQPLRIELKAEGANVQAWFDDLHLSTQNFSDVCTPHRAKATATLVNGVFVGATLTDDGCGYTNAPSVEIQGGGGTGASARAIMVGGRVTEIRVTNGGCCYTNPPAIVISSPPMAPKLAINVSRVKVTQFLVQGWKYVLETSTNNAYWTPAAPPFVADAEVVNTEFDTGTVGRYFRLRVVE